MEVSCISISLTARSWKSTRKKTIMQKSVGAVLCRPVLSVKIHLWGTAITVGGQSFFAEGLSL